MSDEITGSVADWNRRAALEEIELLKVVRSTAWDEHTHSFRWLMASLLGINGAACLGILNLAAVPLGHRMMACGLFAVGVLVALLVAVFGQHSVQKSLAPLQKQVGYWMTVAQDGVRDESLEAALIDEFRTSAKIGLGSRIAGWTSALLFVSGAITVGLGVQAQEKDQNLAKAQVQPGSLPK